MMLEQFENGSKFDCNISLAHFDAKEMNLHRNFGFIILSVHSILFLRVLAEVKFSKSTVYIACPFKLAMG